MKQRLHLWLLLFCLILVGRTGALLAQSPQTIEVGPHVGMTTYLGDINTWKLFNQFDLEYGALARYNYDSRWAFRIDYNHSTVKSTDTIEGWRPERLLNFRSKVNDLSLVVEFNFLNYYTGRVGSSISPYIFAGISVFSYDVHSYTGRADLDTLCLMNFPALETEEGMPSADVFSAESPYWMKKNEVPYWQRHHFSASIPFGFGCKFSLMKRLATSIEWRMHYTFTDYLDGVHGVYPDDGSHVVVNGYDMTDPSGTFHGGQQRGNSQSMDWFGSLNVSLTWKFEIPKKTPCNLDF